MCGRDKDMTQARPACSLSAYLPSYRPRHIGLCHMSRIRGPPDGLSFTRHAVHVGARLSSHYTSEVQNSLLARIVGNEAVLDVGLYCCM